MTLEKARLHYNTLKEAPFKTVFDCYAKPSERKIAINGICVKTAIERDCFLWGVTTYSTNKFTFVSVSRLETGHEYLMIDTGYSGLETFTIDPITEEIRRCRGL